ncbi:MULTISPECIES: hypothetical protein [unclassified Brevibacterium]|uniref:hypothetical protein n=1 Tax=unclassified Brevibacterium TaxID=2614124 RepID=UPI001E5A52CE|nr:MULTISPECIES: hypothetical protein [unclassified Brevibacterium]MCD1287333.1 hypothetical protein [Brevibacterium sp. CCUG 69071]MDK8436412.1 hypothetical protein [Brevibacterium sp. H-BE7]
MTILKETATLTPKAGGRAKIGIITPGAGSSGVYPKETIEAAGRDRVFAKGTQMFWNHATEAEDWNRPEGDLHNLVGVLAEDAHWDDESGGLIAEAKIYSHWKSIVADMAEDIGVSIRASGEVSEANGQRVVTKLTEARSVDFVTRAGRGGRVMEVLESARLREGINDETRDLLQKAVRDTIGNRDMWMYVRDHDDSTVWFSTEGPSDVLTTFEQKYTRNGITIALEGEPTEVVPTTVYVPKTTPAPVGNGNQETNPKEAATMADTENTNRVDEADSKNKNGSGGGGGNSGETEVERLKRELAAAKAEIAELKKAKAKEARRTEVAGIVEEAFENLNAPGMKNRLIDQLAESDKDQDQLIKDAKEAADELHQLGHGNGQVRGLGESAPVDTTTNVNESGAPKRTAEDIINALEGAA